MDLVLDNLQRLIYHKTQPTNQPTTILKAICDILSTFRFYQKYFQGNVYVYF